MQDDRVRQPYVMRSYLVPTYSPETPTDAAALAILTDILGDGLASRFGQALQVEQKIAIGSGAWYSPQSRDATTLTIYAVPGQGRTLAEVEAAMDAEIARFIAEGPTEEELERVKRVMRAARIFQQDNQASLARLYGAALAVGISVEDVQNWGDVVERVTAEDVRKAAETHLRIERSVTGWLSREMEKS